MKKSTCFFHQFTSQLDIFELGFKQCLESETSFFLQGSRGEEGQPGRMGNDGPVVSLIGQKINQFLNLNRFCLPFDAI